MSTGPEDYNILCQNLIMDRVSLLKHILCLYMDFAMHICTFKQRKYYHLNGVARNNWYWEQSSQWEKYQNKVSIQPSSKSL